jgi:hypothetical protein
LDRLSQVLRIAVADGLVAMSLPDGATQVVEFASDPPLRSRQRVGSQTKLDPLIFRFGFYNVIKKPSPVLP